ncbi:ribonuclease H-like domain-containing protein [Tanacetum coccineum]|uniref:Ribonuclease H-like domain-containing protein n=1 Tax=Tanacetum coccineum TaxID=301880 RepID=A0ABQ4YSH6_9ASTR
MCDKKNSVLFTNTECVVLSPDFKLLDENHVLLRVPRKDNMYSVDLKNIFPLGGPTCLFVKATLDESNLWHRRLGHINFKTLNKLVRGNLVKGLPSKIFENNHTCVACQKGKQHKASYHLGKFDGKDDEGFFVGYSTNSKAYRVFNSTNRIVEENLHVKFSKETPNIAGNRPNWIFDIDALTISMNYKPVIAGNQTNVYGCIDDPNMPNLEEIVYSDDDEEVGVGLIVQFRLQMCRVSPILTTRVHKDHPLEQIIRDIHLAPQTRRMTKNVTEHDPSLDMKQCQYDLHSLIL